MRTPMILISLLLLICGGALFSATIGSVEYFFDSDPGQGMGSPLSITPGQHRPADLRFPSEPRLSQLPRPGKGQRRGLGPAQPQHLLYSLPHRTGPAAIWDDLPIGILFRFRSRTGHGNAAGHHAGPAGQHRPTDFRFPSELWLSQLPRACKGQRRSLGPAQPQDLLYSLVHRV